MIESCAVNVFPPMFFIIVTFAIGVGIGMLIIYGLFYNEIKVRGKTL